MIWPHSGSSSGLRSAAELRGFGTSVSVIFGTHDNAAAGVREAVGVPSIRDAFLGVRQPPLTWGEAHGKRFSTHRRGYDVEQVDAFLDQAELRLAARESRAAAGRSTVAVEVQRIKITIVYERVR